jgi:hypothetical protein
MTVGELIEELKRRPPDVPVILMDDAIFREITSIQEMRLVHVPRLVQFQRENEGGSGVAEPVVCLNW